MALANNLMVPTKNRPGLLRHIIDVSPFKQALDNWLSSNDGIKCINTYNIKMPPDQKQYLLNRLKTAFMAGWNAKEKMG